MDNLFLELMGKPKLSTEAKLITVVADNFSLLEDQATFLRATLAIPLVKKLPLDNLSTRLIQIGPLTVQVEEQVRKSRWAINQYEDFNESICDRISEDLTEVRNRSLIFINDISRLELSSLDPEEPRKLLALADRLKRDHGHFIVILFQNSSSQFSSRFLRDIEYMSDAFVNVKSCKVGYFKSMWWQMPTPHLKGTLIPPKVETEYYTCKIGKFYWSSDLLCFYEKKKVPKNYDYNTDSCVIDTEETVGTSKGTGRESLRESILSDEQSEDEEKGFTLPYAQAQNPEKSRIFYYPDKDDDIDEDDPDNDLGI